MKYIGVSYNVVGYVLTCMGYVCCYLVFSSCSVSNIGLCLRMYMSLICNLSLLNLYMWHLSNVFKCFVCFLCFYNVHILVILLCACPVLSV
jgi:hypothetical protein